MNEGDPILGMSERFWIRAFWALAIAGILWRVIRFAVGMPLWGDEAMLGLGIVERDFEGLLRPLDNHQVAPVVYLWLAKAAELVWGANEYSMRVTTLLEGLAALGLLAVVLRRILPPPEAVFAFGVIAVGTYSVRHAVELKPYAQDLLVSCLVWWGLLNYSENPNWRRCLLLAALLAVAVLSSFPGIFVAGGAVLAIALVPNQPTKFVVPHMAVLATVTVAAFGVVYLHSIRGQLSQHANGMVSYWSETFPPSVVSAIPIWWIKTHAGNMMAYPFGGKNFASILTFLAALAGFSILVKRKNWFWVTAVVVPFGLTFAAACLRLYPYGGSARVSQHLVPAIALLTGVGICAFLKLIPAGIRQKRIIIILLLALLLLAIGGAVADVVRPYKIRGVFDAREAVRAWTAALSPSDQIECLNPPRQWDACLNWLFFPVHTRFNGEGWPGDGRAESGRIWVLNGDPNVKLLEIVKTRWPHAKVVDHHVDDFSLIPPNPLRQRFEWVQLQSGN